VKQFLTRLVTAERRLVPWPRMAGLVATACAAVFTVMAVAFHDKRTGTAFDTHVDGWIRRRNPHLLNDLVKLADPIEIAVLFVILIVIAYRRGRRNVALLALLTPIVATVLTEKVLKPGIHRTQSDPYVVFIFGGREPLAFPSGHETGIGSLLAVLGLLVITSGWSRWRRAAVIIAMAALDVVAAIGLVGRYYHYATDTIGALLVCIVVMLVLALLIDAASSRWGAREPELS
jgi:membrane-associated phospholipid phosphatase